MAVTLTNRPSPRPGFTYVAMQRARESGPVVVVLTDVAKSATALQRAAAEAGIRSAPLHVLSIGGSRHPTEETIDPVGSVDHRTAASVRAVLHNPNVTISPVDRGESTDDAVAEYCRSHGASLLVVAHDDQSLTPTGGPAGALGCDVLFVHSQRHG